MSLMVELELESADDFDKCDQSQQWAPGYYRTVLNEIFEKHDEPGQFELQFQVTHGSRKGQTKKAWLNHPNTATDTSKAKTLRDKFLAWGKRLGVVTKEMLEANRVAFNIEDALGTNCVIQIIPSRRKAVDQTTGKETWVTDESGKTEIAYLGVFPLDHYEIPDESRAELELPPANVPADVAAKRERQAAQAAKKGEAGTARGATRKAKDPATGGSAAGNQGGGSNAAATAAKAGGAATPTVATPAVQHNYADL